MIIENGTIQPIVNKAICDFDDEGIPVQAIENIGEEIPANINQNSQNKRTKEEDANYTSTSLTILVDDTDFSADEIVVNKRGKRLGVFRVISIDYLDEVDALKLIVESHAD